MKEFLFLIQWYFSTKFLKKKIPFNGAIIINDLCNLNCKHCTVSSREGKNIPFEQIKKDLKTLYKKGIRYLEITGGEPTLYRDNDKNLNDIIKFAKEIGFFRVLLCTNAILPINTSADYVWVSIDGDKATHDSIRGKTYDRIISNIEKSTHKKIFVNFTISTLNAETLEYSVEKILSNKNIKGILFHFFIPYLNSDIIGVYGEKKNKIIDKITLLKKKYGKKICNTYAALRFLKNENWEKPVWGSLIIYNGDVSPCCCRCEIVNEEICNKCLSTPAVETYVVQNIKLPTVLEIIRNFY